ncbi:nitroreductase family protein [Klenkia terrae]|uniref:nitroreductase family protein n=1 Tax=Klenkia terrae TaxID=1052259 RepID=UPI00360C4424
MEFAEVLRRRRMVRDYDPDRPVPGEVRERLLAHALRAPSAGFSQGWAFLVLESPEERDAFWTATTGDGAPDGWLTRMRRAPLLVVPFSHKAAYLDRYAEPDKGWTDRDEARWPVPYWDVDTGMASLMMLLTAVDEGLGACFFGVPPSGWPGCARRSASPRRTRRSAASRSATRVPRTAARRRCAGAGAGWTRSCTAAAGAAPAHTEPVVAPRGLQRAGRRSNLALLGLLLVAGGTGVLGFAVGTPTAGRVVAVAHGAAGLGLLLLVPWKTVVVRRARSKPPALRAPSAAYWLTGLVAVCVVSGVLHAAGAAGIWATSGTPIAALQVHVGTAIGVVVVLVAHVWGRHQRPRPVDLSRRTLLGAGALAGGSYVLWTATEGIWRLTGVPGATRSGTGSYQRGTDDPRPCPSPSGRRTPSRSPRPPRSG